jgi:multiple sugar transport system permease protein
MGFMKSLLADPSLALGSIILADIWSKTSLMFLILLAGLQVVSPDLYEAARIDGASSWQLFRHITFPLIKPAVVIALIIRFIDAFNVFDTIFVMTSGGPGTATQTFPLLGWKIGFLYFNLGQAATLAIIMLIMTIGVSIFLIRRIT